jgi:predicted RNA-binding Zn ribbon-like protein
MLDPQDYTGTYKVIAGELCLDFANTVSWRGQDREHEWLHNVSNYIIWGHMVGLLSTEEVAVLELAAEQKPEIADVMLTRAKALREAINRIFSNLSHDKVPEDIDISLLNELMSEALHHLRVEQQNGLFHWSWSVRDAGVDRLIWPAVWSAANLLMSDEVNRLGTCEGCNWLFIDTSRNHSRRWCTMEDCGNRAKVRRHRKQLDG